MSSEDRNSSNSETLTMSQVLKNSIIIDYNHYNESDRYDRDEDRGKSGRFVNWSEHLITFILSQLHSITHKRRDRKVLRVQRNSEQMKLSVSQHSGQYYRRHTEEGLPTDTGGQFLRVKQLCKTSSYETISDDCQSDTTSEHSLISCTHSVDSSSSFDNIRIINRFGVDLKDKCLFPLTLPIDARDLTKGKLSWETILMQADIELNKWEKSASSARRVNKVLGNSSDFVCPNLSLQTKFLMCPKAQTVLKRWNSCDSLQVLNHELTKCDRERCHWKTALSTDDQLFARQQFENDNSGANERNKEIQLKVELNGYSNNSYEMKCFKRKSSHIIGDKLLAQRSVEYDAKALIRSIKINSPITLALQITKLDRELFLRLKVVQLFHCAIGKCSIIQNCDLTEIYTLLKFGDELKKLVLTIIRRELTAEMKGKRIAAFIEVGCALRKFRNWHSLCIIIRALQSPKIYFMEEAWMHTKKMYPILYNDYLKLSRIVRSCETCILRSDYPCIPALTSLVMSLRLQTIEIWDQVENKRRWTDSPNIANWLQLQLTGQLLETQKLINHYESRRKETNVDHCSLLPIDDPIRLINTTSLPTKWLNKDARFISLYHLKQIIKTFHYLFKNEMKPINRFYIGEYRS